MGGRSLSVTDAGRFSARTPAAATATSATAQGNHRVICDRCGALTAGVSAVV